MSINQLLSGSGEITFDDIDDFMEKKESQGNTSGSTDQKYPKVPVGADFKCCWVCRSSGVSLCLLPQSDTKQRFKENPIGKYDYPLNIKETLWANRATKVWSPEKGVELAWTCFDCAH